ncbi:hypothetical protein, partial [Pseudomonas sp. GD03903]
MGSIKVERLAIRDISGESLYEAKTSSAVLHAEHNSQMTEFKVVLKAGTYSHFGDAAGNGAFELELVTGSTFRGFVESSFPARTPDGVNT